MFDKPLFSVNSYEFRTRHLLVVAVLVLSFTVSVLFRAQPAEYGLILNEYDPFFNYRATEFLLENGLEAYGDWHDDLSWYPQGRDISKTSQFMQHGTAAALYAVFGGGSDLEEFLVVLPAVLGALTGIIVFAIVRVIAGTTAGLFASLFYAISLPIAIRGSIGWFKAEPLGLFYGMLGIYLFLSGITCARRREAALRLAGAGIVMAMGLSAWGGIQFFIIPLGIFFMALPFLRRDHSFLIWAVPLFAGVLLVTTATFERPGVGFVLGLGGVSLAISAAVMSACIFLWKASQSHGARNSIILILAIVGIATAVLATNAEGDYLDLPSFRYLNALNPFLTTTHTLVDSVSEHASLTPQGSFYFLSTFMIFAGLGVWFLISRREKIDSYGLPLRTDMIAYAIIISFAGIYISSAFTRLVLFASVSMAIVGSIGVTILVMLIMSNKNARAGLKVGFVGVIVVIFAAPLAIPEETNWLAISDVPPVIMNGGTSFNVATNDWYGALEWLRTETPKDSVIMSWWDYGYWIETVAERTTLVDNLTISTSSIQEVAKIFYSEPDVAWVNLNQLDVDYVVVFVGAQNVSPERSYYVLQGGGDETKKVWIARIAELIDTDYINTDFFTPKPEFYDTTLGQMIPFSHARYVNIATGLQSVMWQPGFVSVVQKDVKISPDSEGPFRLAYASPSFEQDVDGTIIGVFVYEINSDYLPEIDTSGYGVDVISPFIQD